MAYIVPGYLFSYSREKDGLTVTGTYCLCRSLFDFQAPTSWCPHKLLLGIWHYLLDSKTSHSYAHYRPQLNSLVPKEQFIKSWEQLAMCACTLALVGRDRQTLSYCELLVNDRTYINE